MRVYNYFFTPLSVKGGSIQKKLNIFLYMAKQYLLGQLVCIYLCRLQTSYKIVRAQCLYIKDKEKEQTKASSLK